jgi:hypothetical protein
MTDLEEFPRDDKKRPVRWRRRYRINAEVALLTWHTVLVTVATWEVWPFH